jgi:hypothetical protein
VYCHGAAGGWLKLCAQLKSMHAGWWGMVPNLGLAAFATSRHASDDVVCAAVIARGLVTFKVWVDGAALTWCCAVCCCPAGALFPACAAAASQCAVRSNQHS